MAVAPFSVVARDRCRPRGDVRSRRRRERRFRRDKVATGASERSPRSPAAGLQRSRGELEARDREEHRAVCPKERDQTAEVKENVCCCCCCWLLHYARVISISTVGFDFEINEQNLCSGGRCVFSFSERK